jgi:hypothetical protein
MAIDRPDNPPPPPINGSAFDYWEDEPDYEFNRIDVSYY